ncbi:proteinase-activated receptor 3 [Ctenodactylus gundi]
MKSLVAAAAALLLLSPTFCQRGKKNVADNLAKPTLTAKTSHGTASNPFEDLLLAATEGWTGATRMVKMNHPEGLVSDLHMNNATLRDPSSSLSTKVVPAIYLLVCAVGVPANAVALWRIFLRTTPTHMMVFHTNLAIVDILFCVTLPFKIAYHLNRNNWVFGETMCRAITVIFYGHMYCSLLFLACRSISRYLAIVHPFRFQRMSKSTWALMASSLVWAMVFLYMLPFFIPKPEDYHIRPNITIRQNAQDTCESSFPFQRAHFLSSTVFGFLIPFLMITYCYATIICTLRVRGPRVLRYIKGVLLVLITVTMCFVPSNVLLVIYHVNYYSNNTDSLSSIYLTALCLGSLNSCLDPFLYFLMAKVVDQLRM